ncbi:MAG TPA: transposase [Myxococcota bacterium]|nr:transposase [Myxococcota bacterium]
MPRSTIATCASTLESALSPAQINALGLATGQSQRLRVVTPARLLTTLLGGIGGGSVESIADLCREFNFQHGTTTAYKAFYNRLAHPGFPTFMRAVVDRLLVAFAMPTLAAGADSSLRSFEDIVIQDGSSFALSYFRELRAAGASWVLRLSRAYRPWVVAIHRGGQAEILAEPVALPKLLQARGAQPMDLDVEFRSAPGEVFRLVLLRGRDPWLSWLCTELPRDRFSPADVGKVYRLRWQIELVFKEWKSYANLHAFDTANEHIAEGLIWASLAAAILKRFVAHVAQAVGAKAISTRKVAMCAQLFLRGLCRDLGAGRPMRPRLRRLVDYITVNAARAAPKKERRRGRLSMGLEPVGA